MEPTKTLAATRLPDPPEGKGGWPWVAPSARAPLPGDRAWPMISVVIPSYQQGQFLEECIRSVLLQDYPNFECIVMDGGSTDESVEILKKYGAHLAHWQSAKDNGQGAAINDGFALSKGDVLGWINSDDMQLPGALRAVAEAFRRSGADIVYGDALTTFEGEQVTEYWEANWVIKPFLQFGGIVSSHAIFWKRSVHCEIWTEMNCNIDGELWRRLIPGRRLKYLPQPLGLYRVHPETKSQAEKWREAWKRDLVLLEARHGKESRNRVFRRLYAGSQKLFKWFAWRRNVEGKRKVLQACGWDNRKWRGPRP
jgi:glycosyltransferase involved in cell wall biosynthesis